MEYNQDYQKVAERQQIFKKDFKSHKIVTHLLDTCIIDGKHQVMIKCEILNGSGKVCATGIALEREGTSKINKTNWAENAETSAIGRAFRALGIGDNSNYAAKEEVDKAKEKLGKIEKTDNVSKGKALTSKAKKDLKPIDLSFITDDRSKAGLVAMNNGFKMMGLTKAQLTLFHKNFDKDGKYPTLLDFMSKYPTKDLKEFIESQFKK
jgi:hypothetical protein